VRQVVSTEIGLVVAFAAALLVAYVGLAVTISGENRFAGVLVLGLGVWSMVAAPVVHDRLHRERGEPSHAVWGRDDRRKPPWWPAR
jgi:membrane protein YdbS with pleckstrin-like domain